MIFLGLTPKRYTPLGGTTTDADAQAFITAAGITDGTQQSAVNQLVLDLKSANIWTKMKAIYPILGGSASSHKWNLKDARDLDAAFRLTFSTGWTHSSNGMTPNGTSAFANTFCGTNEMNINSAHISFYSRTNNSVSGQEMGALQNLPNSYTDLSLNYPGYGAFTRINNGGTPVGVVNSDSTGFYIATRTASNILNLFKNNNKIRAGTDLSNATSTRPIYIGGLNNQGSAGFYTNRQCAFASIGDGLTDTEAANFYTAVNTYQTTLGRNV